MEGLKKEGVLKDETEVKKYLTALEQVVSEVVQAQTLYFIQLEKLFHKQDGGLKN
jgi:hypothetical protein